MSLSSDEVEVIEGPAPALAEVAPANSNTVVAKETETVERIEEVAMADVTPVGEATRATEAGDMGEATLADKAAGAGEAALADDASTVGVATGVRNEDGEDRDVDVTLPITTLAPEP